MADDPILFWGRVFDRSGNMQPFDHPGNLKVEGDGGAGTRVSLAEDVPHDAWTTSERGNADLLLVPGKEGGIVANNAPLSALRAIGRLGAGNSLLTPGSWRNYHTVMGIRNKIIDNVKNTEYKDGIIPDTVFGTRYGPGGMGYSSDDPDDINAPLARSAIQKIMMDRLMENPVLRNLADGYDTDPETGKPVSGTPVAGIARKARNRYKRGYWTWNDLISFLMEASTSFEQAVALGDIDYNPLLDSGAIDEGAADVLFSPFVRGNSNKVVVPKDEDFSLLRKYLIQERKAAGREYNGKEEDIVSDFMFDKLVDYLWETASRMQAFSFGSKPNSEEKEYLHRAAKRYAEFRLRQAGFKRRVSEYKNVMQDYKTALDKESRRKDAKRQRTYARVYGDADMAARREARIAELEKRQAKLEKALSREGRKAYLDKWEKKLKEAHAKAVAAAKGNEEDMLVVEEHYSTQFARLERKKANIDKFCNGAMAVHAREVLANQLENYKKRVAEGYRTLDELNARLSDKPLRDEKVDEAEEALELYYKFYKERLNTLAHGEAEIVTLSGKASDIADVNDMIRGKQGSALEHMNQKLLKTGTIMGDSGWKAKDLKERCVKYFALRNDWSRKRISGRDAFREAFGLDPDRIPSDMEIKELHDDYQGYVDRAERQRRITDAVRMEVF